ncbi:MAG: YtxH domain-containing protein [Myxococcales bacterium]|jgi:hypothetical protein|nr:YtxH domain-containing protein [Myxococcales bacterium]
MKIRYFLETYGAYRALNHLKKMKMRHPMMAHGYGFGGNCWHMMKRRQHMMNAATGVGSFAVGAAVGGLLGILFAPKKGTDTRDDIKANVEKVKTKIEGELQKA